MTKDEALRMALRWFTDVSTNNEDEVIQACKDALEQPTTEQSSLVQEPAPSREWVKLSDDEIEEVFNLGHKTIKEFARAIEAKLKEKNG